MYTNNKMVAEWVWCLLSTRETRVRPPLNLIPPRGQKVVFLVIEFQPSWFGFHINL